MVRYTRRNYLRVRGEYSRILKTTYKPWELPPRARRIPISTLLPINCLGTTSACAENTGIWLAGGVLAGTTSACAENTSLGQTSFLGSGNYLRVRGEYWRNANDPGTLAELPPRARRIQVYP